MSICKSSPHEPEHRLTKTGLFCPTCDHESPLDGDWIADDSVRRERLLCPRCGDVVVDQPEF
jgi:hypothetical protein